MKKKKIGYLAPEGTFSHEAALKRGGKDAKVVGFLSFSKLIEAVMDGSIDEVVAPIENLLVGGVDPCLDSIINANGKVKIRGELILPVTQHLISLSETLSLSEIKTIVSIREAINQCEEWLNKYLPNVKIEYVGSTAEAVKNLHAYGRSAAAVGSILAAKHYKRKILKKQISDNTANATHFLVLAKSDERRSTGKDKTSMIFTTPNKPGALLRVLNIFDALDINMIKIESRPSKKKMHEYIFWIDIDGHRREDAVKIALKAVKAKTEFLKILGSYPKY